jgi:hypothetical protein
MILCKSYYLIMVPEHWRYQKCHCFVKILFDSLRTLLDIVSPFLYHDDWDPDSGTIESMLYFLSPTLYL